MSNEYISVSTPSILPDPIKHNTPTDIALPIIMVCQKDIPVLSNTSKMLPVCLLLQGTFVYDGGEQRKFTRAAVVLSYDKY